MQPPAFGPTSPGAPPPPAYHGHPVYRPVPPQKKKTSGCLIAVLVIMGMGLLVGVGGGIWLYRQFGAYGGAVKELAEVSLAAQSAPGTGELRDAGCDEAMAIDAQKISSVLQKIEDITAKKENRKPKPIKLDDTEGHVVVCKVNIVKEPPTCDAAAKVFVQAAKPSKGFILSVQKGNTKSCSAKYTSRGEQLGASDFTMPAQ